MNAVGQRVARNSDLPDLEWKFTVVDEGSINAFTTGGGYVYVHRGLLAYLNSEAELAAVLGHEIAHVTARHPARGQTRSVLANILAMGAAVVTGSGAVADIASIGAGAFVQGYGREAEIEADRIGMKYLVKAGYDPQGHGPRVRDVPARRRASRWRARAPRAASRASITACFPRIRRRTIARCRRPAAPRR